MMRLKIKKLERKVRKLEKERNSWRAKWNKSHDFEIAFRRFYNRTKNEFFSSTKYEEALFHLKEKLEE